MIAIHRKAWKDRMNWPFVGWLVTGIAIYFLSEYVTTPQVILLSLTWLIVGGIANREFLTSFFGPVLTFDFIRLHRRNRTYKLRVGYALVLAIVFAWSYFAWQSDLNMQEGGARARDQAKFAQSFFGIFMGIQFMVLVIMTPGLIAGTITSEKEQRTMEFLLATDLRDREILFGKLASRLGLLLLVMLAGLPILSMNQFFGGVQPEFVFAGFIASFLTVLSLAALSLANSVLARRTRDAIALTYLVGISYVFASSFIYMLFTHPSFAWSIDLFGLSLSSADLGYVIVAGNPFYIVGRAVQSLYSGGNNVLDLLKDYAIFHIVVIAILMFWSGWKLRDIALRQQFGSSRRSRRKAFREHRRSKAHLGDRSPVVEKESRPDVGEQPVLWKEAIVDSGLKLGRFAKLIIWLMIAMTFCPAFIILYNSFFVSWSIFEFRQWWTTESWEDLGESMQIYSMVVTAILSTLMLLATAIRSAGSIVSERDHQTMDVLLTTTLSAREILWGKWWGSIFGMRTAWLWVYCIWIFAMTFGGLHPFMLLPIAISCFIYAGGISWIGIYCSLRFRSSLRATLVALFSTIFLCGGYFLLYALLIVLPMEILRIRDKEVEFVFQFLCSFSPPVNVTWLQTNRISDSWMIWDMTELNHIPFWLIGLFSWILFALFLSRKCIKLFAVKFNRH